MARLAQWQQLQQQRQKRSHSNLLHAAVADVAANASAAVAVDDSCNFKIKFTMQKNIFCCCVLAKSSNI